MSFKNRYEILLQSSQATEESIAITREIVHLVERRYQIRLDESNGASLVTHLAITLKKIQEQEALIEIPEICLQEAHSYLEEMEFAGELVQYLHDNHGIDFNKSESAFLTIHLKNITQHINTKEVS